VDFGHNQGVLMGWYGNNCECSDQEWKASAVYIRQDAEMTAHYGFDAVKVDSCGPAGNITEWRYYLDKFSPPVNGKRTIELENCRVWTPWVTELRADSLCEAELFRTTEDNAPHFLSIMRNLITNARMPGSEGDVHGGLPVSHQNCWAYPDMLETLGSGQCGPPGYEYNWGPHKDLPRPKGGLNFHESETHFYAWCIVSSPLILSHDLSSDEEYDAAWPIISNTHAIAINQAWAGDAGRLLLQSTDLDPTDMLTNLTLFHGAKCEDASIGQKLPRWLVFGKRIAGRGGHHAALDDSAAVLLINLSDEPLPAAHVSLSFSKIFGDGVGVSRSRNSKFEFDVARQKMVPTINRDPTQCMWHSAEVAPHSSYFVRLDPEPITTTITHHGSLCNITELYSDPVATTPTGAVAATPTGELFGSKQIPSMLIGLCAGVVLTLVAVGSYAFCKKRKGAGAEAYQNLSNDNTAMHSKCSIKTSLTCEGNTHITEDQL